MEHRQKANFHVRRAVFSDADAGLLDTLSHLSDLEGLAPQSAKEIMARIMSSGFDHRIFVAVTDDGSVIGTATLLIEQKLIHNGGKVGHIEDVATREGYEGNGVGGAVVQAAIDFASEHGCYKVILDCSKKNEPFYEKLGFKARETEMRLNLPRKRD